jgi:DNA-binding IclR family transcriptional regulator
MHARQSHRIVSAAPLKRYTDNTVTNPKRLMAELERIRMDRLSTDDEEYLAGMIGVAVPVVDRSNRVCAGLAVHALAARMSLEVAKQYVPTLRKASAALTAACFPE